eukprot:gene12166-13421_t
MDRQNIKPLSLENRLLTSSTKFGNLLTKTNPPKAKSASASTKPDHSSADKEILSRQKHNLKLSGSLTTNKLLVNAPLQRDLSSFGLQSSKFLGLGKRSQLDNPLLSTGASSGLQVKPKTSKSSPKTDSKLTTLSRNPQGNIFQKKTLQKEETKEVRWKESSSDALKDIEPGGNQDAVLAAVRQTYKFSLEEDSLPQLIHESEKSQYNFSSSIKAGSQAEKQKKYLIEQKSEFLNQAALAIVQRPDFYLKKDNFRVKILELIEKLQELEPEFILKVALYLRKDLNIRTCAHFIVAAAAFHAECRPYLKRYFSAIITLPSDWIEVAEFYVTLHDKDINFGSLPTALRKVMVEKFPSFDEYQLAKYNKEKSRLKKGKKLPNMKGTEESSANKKPANDASDISSESDSEDESDEELQRKAFTLKQLIRKLHISQPVNAVMCIIGKLYPSTREEFRLSRLEGDWNEERAGKRMKLPTPETWETQVSLKGNKASTWEQLLDHRKLPFMAMLRNLRNMIQTGISYKHHNMVIKKLTDEKSVISSKQFPFRFLSAYEILDELDGILKSGKVVVFDYKSSLFYICLCGFLINELEYDSSLLKKYRKALDTALRISCANNINPIPGTSIVICDVDEDLNRQRSGGAIGKRNSIYEIGLLLGLMARYSCEECKVLLMHGENYLLFEIEDQSTILANLIQAKEKAEVLKRNPETATGKTQDFFRNIVTERTKVDNVITFGGNFNIESCSLKRFLTVSFGENYRKLVHPKMLLVTVNLAKASTSVTEPRPDNLEMFGYSDQLLRYVAERGNESLMTYVENIDVAFDLRKIKISSSKGTMGMKKDVDALQLVKAESNLPCWKNVRVFISSTFRDMHGERDLLTRYIFPELRSRAMQHFVNIYEIDLRWGITDEQSKSQSQVDICLSEAGKSDLLIGLLGDRYGWIPDSFDINDIPGGEGLVNCSQGRSITELEMRLFALCQPEKASGKAFFYIRDRKFTSHVPVEYQSDFYCDNKESEMKLKQLKDDLKSSGLEVFENYPCKWGGVVDGKPVVSNLEEFGSRVLNNIWTAIKTNFLQEEEEGNGDAVVAHEAFTEKAMEHYVGRKSLIKQCQELIKTSIKKKCGVLMISGTSGSGKTSFMAKLKSEFNAENGCSISYFADAVLDARNVQDLVRFVYASLLLRVESEHSMPDTFRELQAGLSKLLEEVGENYTDIPFVIFIDGIDTVTTTGRTSVLGWLPDPVPKGVMFVITCLQDGACAKYLEARKAGVEEVRIGPLDMMERTELVRKLLRKHRKILDESAFNNQMKLLVSKREAKLPIFLKFACEELRFFGVYEKVSDHLRKLAQTVPVLLQSIADRLESDHGKDLVSWCTIILYISRQGLSEDELYEMICSLHSCQALPTQNLNNNVFLERKAEITPKMSRAFFAILTRSLRGFIQQSDEQSLQLSFSDARNLVKQRYIRVAGADTVIRVHRILAAYYKKRAFDGDWVCRDAKALSEVTFHMASGCLWNDLEDAVCSFSFICSKFQMGLGNNLLEDFLANVDEQSHQFERQKLEFMQRARVQEYQSFVRRNFHILNQFPILVFQQALNDPELQQLNADAAKCSIKHNVVHWINKPPGSSPIKKTMTNFKQSVLSLDVSTDGSLLACGTRDGVLRLFDTSTGSDAGSFIGHSAAISSCCFVGRQRIVSASLDGTLSVWDVAGGHRVHHLKRHRRGVTDCICVPSSQQIVSVALDCQAILWNVQSGIDTLQFKSGGRPLNCAACHPDGNLVALGGWNCLIKVWDILSNKRKSVLKGHESSVRAVAFSTSGEHLISAALLGDVYIWATASAVRVGKFSSSSLDLNDLKYTLSGLKMFGASTDSAVKVWSGTLGQPCGTFSASEGSNSEWALSVIVDQKGVAAYVGYHDGSVICFDYASRTAIKKLALHKSAVRSICLSKCERYLLTASDDRTAKVIDLKTWNVITLDGHTESVRCVRASSSQFATCSDDYTIMLWNALFLDDQSSIKPAATLQHHTGYVTCCDFSPCETRLMTVSTDKSLVIWDIISLKPIHILNNCHRDWISACAWSDVGDYVVTGSNDFTLKLWDAKTGTEKHEFLGNTSAINAVAYKFGCVASISYHGSLKVWTHKGAEITTIHAHDERVNNVCLWAPARPDVGDWNFEDVNSLSKNQAIKANQPNLENVDALTVSDDGTMKRWKPFKSHLIQNLNGHTDAVSNLAVSPNGEELFSSSFDKTVKCWDIQKIETKEIPHTADVTCVKISPSGLHAASTARDGRVVIWDLASYKQIGAHQVSAKSGNCVCFVSNDEFIVGDDECMLTAMNINGTQIHRRMIDGVDSRAPITAIQYQNDILVCTDLHNVSVAIMKNAASLKTADFITNGPSYYWNMGIDFRPDGKKLVGYFNNANICSYSVSVDENKVRKGVKNGTKNVSIQLTGSSDIILTTCNSGLASEVLFEIQDERIKSTTSLKILEGDNTSTLIEFICGTSDGYVQLIAEESEEVFRMKAFKVHEKSVYGLVVLRNCLITASSDTTVKVWQLPSMQDERTSMKQIGLFFCRGPVTALDACYSGGNMIIFAGDKTGNVEILEFYE